MTVYMVTYHEYIPKRTVLGGGSEMKHVFFKTKDLALSYVNECRERCKALVRSQREMFMERVRFIVNEEERFKVELPSDYTHECWVSEVPVMESLEDSK